MDFHHSEDRQMLGDTLRRFLAEKARVQQLGFAQRNLLAAPPGRQPQLLLICGLRS